MQFLWGGNEIVSSLRLDELEFDNRFVRSLPGDMESANFRRQVRGACWSRVRPAVVSGPRLLAWSREMVSELGLSAAEFESGLAAEVFSGNRLLGGMDPYAMCYGGHQFGNWAGQLGDGRAINLGEVVNGRGQRWVLQLKGAGPTPYSRTADGLAVLRSSLREFVCSEAMHHLGIATTRALCLTSTGELVTRDMFYDGHPRKEPGAIVCRVAPTFTRFGNFQILAARKEQDLLGQLVDYTIGTDFPEFGGVVEGMRSEWFRLVCERTADMVVDWMRVGFVHGVVGDERGLQAGIDAYVARFNSGCRRMMAGKLGLLAGAMGEHADAVAELSDSLLGLMQRAETDMTILFRGLGSLPMCGVVESVEGELQDVMGVLSEAWYEPGDVGSGLRGEYLEWQRRYRGLLKELGVEETSRRAEMSRMNPKYVFRNYLAQLAIDRVEAGDVSLLWELLEVLRRPYEEQPEKGHLAAKRPEWARDRAGCSMLSCSS